MEEERLQKYLAECGIGSRRKCEEYILQGKVKINGKHEVLSVKIDSNANLTSDDLEMLEDMIMIAMNNANKKAENFKAEKLSKFGNIPGLL